MRHRLKDNHLGRTTAHRHAMLSNMATSLILHKRIQTTLVKARSLRRYVEPLLTRGKTDSTHSRRTVFAHLRSKEAVKELFGEIGPKIMERPGGYTRILKLGPRQGDGAEMALVELVDYNEFGYTQNEQQQKSKTRRRRGKKTGAGAATPAAATATAETLAAVSTAETVVAPATQPEPPQAQPEADLTEATAPAMAEPGATEPEAAEPEAAEPADSTAPEADAVESPAAEADAPAEATPEPGADSSADSSSDAGADAGAAD